MCTPLLRNFQLYVYTVIQELLALCVHRYLGTFSSMCTPLIRNFYLYVYTVIQELLALCVHRLGLNYLNHLMLVTYTVLYNYFGIYVLCFIQKLNKLNVSIAKQLYNGLIHVALMHVCFRLQQHTQWSRNCLTSGAPELIPGFQQGS